MSLLLSSSLRSHSTCFIAPDPTRLLALRESKKNSTHFYDTLALGTWAQKNGDTASVYTTAQYHENYESQKMVIYVNTPHIGSLDDIPKISRSRWAILKMADNYHRPIDRATEMTKKEVSTVAQESKSGVLEWMASRLMADNYHRPIDRATEMTKKEVSTVAQESKSGVLEWMASRLMADDYRRRINDLREMAIDEGIDVVDASIDEFWELIGTLSATKKAQLVLTQKGGLTTIWKDNDGNYAHIKCFGTGCLRYVIFTGPQHHPSKVWATGGCSIQDVKALLRKHNLNNLLGLYEQ